MAVMAACSRFATLERTRVNTGGIRLQRLDQMKCRSRFQILPRMARAAHLRLSQLVDRRIGIADGHQGVDLAMTPLAPDD